VGLALIALCVALMAAWTALVNHGARRVLAGVLAVVALVGLVALFDLRSIVIVRISPVVGLVPVSAAAARVARRTTPARLSAHVSTRPSRAAHRRHRTPGTSRTIIQAR
jgi:hypothetical protein